MQTRVQKWGNSLAVRIPAALSQRLHLNKRTLINMEIENNCLVIRTPCYDLDELLEKINLKNRQ